MKIKVLFLFLTYISFAYNLTSVSDLSVAKSNIALIMNHEAFVVNPAFLPQTRFAISNQNIDTTKQRTAKQTLSYVIYNGFGAGEMKLEEKSISENATIALFGYGSKINKSFSWGITYQTIALDAAGVKSNGWSTLLGVSYMDLRNKVYSGVTLEHFFKDNDNILDNDFPPTIGFGLNFIPWNKVMWSNKISFIRLAGEKIKYSSGLSLLINDTTMLNVGANENGYALGFDLPFMIGTQSYLGSVKYAVEVPYSISDELIYSFAYTWGS